MKKDCRTTGHAAEHKQKERVEGGNCKKKTIEGPRTNEREVFKKHVFRN